MNLQVTPSFIKDLEILTEVFEEKLGQRLTVDTIIHSAISILADEYRMSNDNDERTS